MQNLPIRSTVRKHIAISPLRGERKCGGAAQLVNGLFLPKSWMSQQSADKTSEKRLRNQSIRQAEAEAKRQRSGLLLNLEGIGRTDRVVRLFLQGDRKTDGQTSAAILSPFQRLIE